MMQAKYTVIKLHFRIIECKFKVCSYSSNYLSNAFLTRFVFLLHKKKPARHKLLSICLCFIFSFLVVKSHSNDIYNQLIVSKMLVNRCLLVFKNPNFAVH